MSYVGAPIRFHETVTPSNVTNLSSPARALYVGVSGDISVVCTGDGSTAVYKNVPVGWHAVECVRVNSTGTTATDIIAGR